MALGVTVAVGRREKVARVGRRIGDGAGRERVRRCLVRLSLGRSR